MSTFSYKRLAGFRPVEDMFELSLIVSIIIVPLLYPEFTLGRATITITEMVTTVILLAFLVRVKIRKLDLKPTLIDLIFLALIIWGAISLTKSVNWNHSIRDYLWLLESGLLFYMVEHGEFNEEQIFRIIRTACYGAVFIGMLSILQYYVMGTRAYTSLCNSNSLSGYLIFFLPILITFKYDKRIDRRFYWGILATIVSTGLVVTFTRGGWYAAIFSLIVLSFMKDKKLLIYIVIYIFAYSIIFTPVFDRAVSVVDEAERQNGQTRIQLWLTAVQMFKDNPVTGVGIGNYYTLHDEYLQRYPHLDRGGKTLEPHNSFLKYLAELGIVGLSMFIVILYIVAGKSLWLWKKANLNYIDSLLAGFICGAGAVLIQSNTNSLLHDSRVVFGLWITTGLAIQLIRKYECSVSLALVEKRTKGILNPVVD